MTKLCVPLTATNSRGMAKEITTAGAAGAHMIELRIDFLDDLSTDSVASLMQAADGFAGEIIVTCRLAGEGGKYTGGEATRASLLVMAAQNGADYIDVEYEAWKRSPKLCETLGPVTRQGGGAAKLILSKHDFKKTPAHLDTILDTMASETCDVVKLVTCANTIVDSLRVLDALRNSALHRPTIALAMGEAGMMTRVLAGKCGGLLTFASLATGKESAPGQVTLDDMRHLYRCNAIGPDTKIYGVIGCPVGHSMSPAILNAAFAEAGLNAVYLPMRVEPEYESFELFIDGCLARPWFGLGGCSVTIPHKQNLLRYVEAHEGEVEALTKRIGAANTLHIETTTGGDDEPWVPPGMALNIYACNTDYLGVLGALCAGMECKPRDLRGKSAAVLGAGGVCRAIVAGLHDCGCDVRIYNRTHAKAEALAAEFDAVALPVEEKASHGADIIVNGTSIGMSPEVGETPMPAKGLEHRPVVFDTIYNPLETRLLREARERGCRTVDGVAMFVRQAAAQFERWLDRPAPLDLMRDVVLARLSE